ncbi:lipid IV(A) 3-deoxy-D-manno-octulosonic acid transferase [Niveibacterium umoris]|uniref:3-deoxy-D-manno-octulosonic acid transferase n=1 Tax=Niveibacterium umoris TaxID=1193620 RepID=A0A840BLA9_9RHOO|nr:glycosyltransferase N-terminal domain-containing protein [Niveibacterium umoris]MBB4012319.1 3-deoxy-D-manno-octulosonic-acid transferase [Niveibacterium umoris]
MKPSFGTWLRYQTFRLIDRAARRGRSPQTTLALPDTAVRRSLWLFVSTIGELNAIAPLLDALAPQTTPLHWVLLTDRRIYAEAYRARYPDADIVEIGDHPAEASRLSRLRPPALALVAEIPLLPSDAPCRLPFAWLYEAARHGAPVASVNGWLYGYATSCRIDTIERGLLLRDWLAIQSVLCVQSEAVRNSLLEAGAPPDKLVITGNIKFDALDRASWTPAGTRSPTLIGALIATHRHVVVAGCVTDEDEQTLVLDAFVNLKSKRPHCLMVLAPRHPEQPEVMANLARALAARGLLAVRRSEHGDQPVPGTIDVLTLDTMGELKDFYACADVAHVGRDHNVLEPLAFGTAVTARPGWNATYPSYPVFRLLFEEHELSVNEDPLLLADSWQAALDVAHDSAGRAARITRLAERFGGATARSLAALAPFVAIAMGARKDRP